MSTELRIRCPSCRRMLKARPEHVNRRAVCNHCRSPFVVRREGDDGPPSEATPVRRGDAPPAAPIGTNGPRAGEAERPETALRDANAELDRTRLTVKILQADLFARAAEVERLESARAAASSETARLRSAMTALEADHARALEEARAGWERERQALVNRAEVALAAQDQAEKEKVQLAGRLRDALTRFGAAVAELEAERRRAEQLDAERRREDAERDRQQAEAARLRAEFEQQRLRREAERQAHHDAFTTLRQTLAERLNSRTPVPGELPTEPTPNGTGAWSQAHEAHCGPAGESRLVGAPHDPYRGLRTQLRDLRDVDINDEGGAPGSTRLPSGWQPDEP